MRELPTETTTFAYEIVHVCNYCGRDGWGTDNPRDPPEQWVRRCKGCRRIVILNEYDDWENRPELSWPSLEDK